MRTGTPKLIRIAYVISGIDYALGFDWLEHYLDRSRYKPLFIFLSSGQPALAGILRERGVAVIVIQLRSKKDYPFVFLKLLWRFIRWRPYIVHAHLFDANLLSIPAAWMLRIKHRIYTRHHSTYHFDYHPHMVKYDKLINHLSTRIASISNVVTKVLVDMEGVPPGKVFPVPHGFELDRFSNPDAEKLRILKDRYGVVDRKPVIGVISRFTEWKGIQYIIPAFRNLIQKYPHARLILANAKGDYKIEIEELLSDLPQGYVVQIPFETDLFNLYHLFDIFVHVPIDKNAEAFGQTYVEALASGIPSVFTLSGIANEFVVDGYNAFVVPYKDANAIEGAVLRLLNDPELSRKLSERGKEDVKARFDISVMMKALYRLYEG
jgi:glycosyltransferase involved in cell wall biosynthesis